MPFPTTPILDTFNRANEGPPPSASWYDLSTGIKVVSNQAVGDDDVDNSALWVGTEFTTSAGQEAFITIATLPPASDNEYVGVGYISASGNGYSVNLLYLSGGWLLTINRYDAFASTGLVIQSVSPSNGIKIGLRSVGGLHTAYINTGSNWVDTISAVDTTYSATDYGMLIVTDGTTARLDDFGGGIAQPMRLFIRPTHRPAAFAPGFSR